MHTEKFRKDYQPYPHVLNSVSLAFDIFDDHTIVTSELAFKTDPNAPIVLDGESLELLSININGNEPAAYELNDSQLILPPKVRISLQSRLLLKSSPTKTHG